MPPPKRLSNLTDDDLLKLVENENQFKAKQTDVEVFVKKYELRPGNKFYSNRFLYFLYKKEGFTESFYRFTKLMKTFVPYKRKDKIRGFLLKDIKETTIQLYEYNQDQKKKTKRRISTTNV